MGTRTIVVGLALLALAVAAAVAVAQTGGPDSLVTESTVDVNAAPLDQTKPPPGMALDQRLDRQEKRLGEDDVIDAIRAMPDKCGVVVEGYAYGIRTEGACRPEAEDLVTELEQER